MKSTRNAVLCRGQEGALKCKEYAKSHYLGLLRRAGLMLYLSPSWRGTGGFLMGTGVGVSISSPVRKKN